MDLHNVQMTDMDGSGKIIIPDKVRRKLKLRRGDKFVVYGEGDTIFIRKIVIPGAKEIRESIKEMGYNV